MVINAYNRFAFHRINFLSALGPVIDSFPIWEWKAEFKLNESIQIHMMLIVLDEFMNDTFAEILVRKLGLKRLQSDLW